MPPRIERWVFVRHARQRQGERDITEDQIKEAVGAGRSWSQGKGARGGVKWVFEKVVDGATLRVATEIKDDVVFVLTAFWVEK